MAQLTEMMDHSGNTITGRTSYLTTPDAQTDKIKVTVRLIELILKMSEAEQRNLIRELENIPVPETRKYAGEKRKHPREKCLIVVNCSSNDVLFTDFIQNINNGGVFIQDRCVLLCGSEDYNGIFCAQSRRYYYCQR